MRQRPRQSFLQGAMILTASTMLVKVIGVFYKIPLGNLLGGVGMSCFMTAYNIFTPVFALSAAGFPAAVSKLMSESAALGRYRDVRRILQVSFYLFLLFGFAGCMFLLFAGGPLARLIGNPHAALSVTAIAPSLFFCCVMSAYRGYYQGLGNMTPTAVSQVLEAVVKLVFGIGIAYFVLHSGLAEFARAGTVFGGEVTGGAAQAELAVLPYASAGAVLGVTLSSAAGAAFLFLRHVFGRDGIDKSLLRESPAPESAGKLLRRLMALALPVCLASGVSHVTNFIDVATVMKRVEVAISRDGAAVLGMYEGLLPAQIAAADIPSYLYGALSYTLSLYNLVPALTVALGISALPALSARWTLRDRYRAGEQARSLVKLAALIAIPAGLGLAAIPGPILALLYPQRLQEVAIAAPVLRLMGIAAVFTGIVAPVGSVFQAVGRADIPVRLMCGGAVLKIAANWFLLAIPSLNIHAAPIGTLLFYLFILGGSLHQLRSAAGIRIEAHKILLKPLVCGILCAIAANTSYELTARVISPRWAVFPAIAAGGLIYAIFVLFLKIITKNEALMLPNGKKVVKILEKLSFLG